MRLNGKILAALCLLLCHSVQGQSRGVGEVYFENLSVDDGLSQLSVIAIFQDRGGYMWFGTRYGLNRYDGREFERFVSDPQDDSSISDNIVNCLAEDGRGNIWIGTTNGLNRFDRVSRTFSRFFISGGPGYDNEENIRAVTADHERGNIYFGGTYGLYLICEDGEEAVPVDSIRERVDALCDTGEELWICTPAHLLIMEKDGGRTRKLEYAGKTAQDDKDGRRALFQDREGRVWLDDNGGGVACYDPRTLAVLSRVAVPHEVRCISEDAGGRILIGTRNGIYLYDEEGDTLSSYDKLYALQPDLGFSPIEDLLLDRSGTLWIGTYSSGVFLSNFLGQRFVLHKPWREPEDAQISLGPMVRDGEDLWIGTDGAGLLRYSMRTGTFRRVAISGSRGIDHADNNVKCLLLEGRRLYIGLYSGKLVELDVSSESVRNVLHLDDRRPVFSLSRYDDGHILLGTYSRPALKLLDTGTMEIMDYPGPQAGDAEISHITVLLRDGGKIYVGTKQNGLYILDGSSRRHFRMDGSFGGYGRMISTLYRDRAGNILVGTSDEGLNVLSPESGQMRNLRRRDGLLDDKVCSVFEDGTGALWMATLSGISRLNEDYSVRFSLNRRSGMGIREFSASSPLVSEDGSVYLGSDSGLLRFRPEDIRLNDRVPPVLIKNVWVKDSRVPVDLENAPELRVRYNEASIRIECRVLNYLYPEQNRLAVMLEGAESEWKDMGTSSIVHYANLSPGRYTFRVKGSNNDGYWNEEGAELSIRVLPPFYRSGAAFFLYLLLLSVFLVFLVSFLRTRMNLAQQILMKQHDEEVFRSKIDFFTNVSHEFRTPLTLIRAPVEEVLSSGDPSRMDLPAFRRVQDNVDRMLGLLEQLMTFRKIESGNMELNASRGDFRRLARKVVSLFETSARLKGIRFAFRDDGVPDPLWFDGALMERVLMNLLSNAFKFTPEGGRVLLRLSTVLRDALPGLVPEGFSAAHVADAERYLRLDVFNSGEPITQDDRQRIFDPFVQGSQRVGGTGIGLSLCKRIVEMHHGMIWLEAGEAGNCFSVVLAGGLTREDVRDGAAPVPEAELGSGSRTVLLVVEDNRELREYLVGRLKRQYRVFAASDGDEGLSLARSAMPSLVLSDIMMPGTDGLQLCRALKGDPATAHIPVILLTARALPSQTREGLEAGADDYIVKPFSMEDLLAKVSNILRSRENLKNLYAKNLSLENMGVEMKSSDEKFLQQLNRAVREHIANPQLDLSEFCRQLGMSRSSMYRKVKETTDMSPSRYINSVRLHLASKMLVETDLSITEIMYSVGFNSPAHFSTAFRKKYGRTPRDFRKEATSGGG